ncbi:hypothetical protein P170DRAFT_384621 [Aspergillus steynii IBT 23096]|uniref:SPRY domain-containing protein n=1 Tax=Aspergillus steynii IBT 23096 TaxID=1392250 RepID=A0A2I2G9L0_9EURO|nr:uncharacterized protein P170DRAFT_384621 [Aspergillus steynii IBT 23096]PLB49561.1 hypothetical protein P170DRAFT_384621 [Aspergillus steynii IBT 23096]
MASRNQDGFREPPPSYHASNPSDDTNPPPYHNWQEAVPDTTTFPPPPITGYYCSGTGNASSNDAKRAHEFCDGTPLYTPVKPSNAVYNSVQVHDVRPVQPQEFSGSIRLLSPGRWKVATEDGNRDCSIWTNLPLFFSKADSPWLTNRSKTIYFEAKLVGLRRGPVADSSGFSIGFLAQPYPSWRSPGWERGSLGVFSDDGCRFVNDSWGGKDFTAGFRAGETVGLGMTFQLPGKSERIAQGEKKSLMTEVFFTRGGRRVGGWDLHEEQDEEAGGVKGLEGDFDLYGAVGFFGGVDVEVNFNRSHWLWNPLS